MIQQPSNTVAFEYDGKHFTVNLWLCREDEENTVDAAYELVEELYQTHTNDFQEAIETLSRVLEYHKKVPHERGEEGLVLMPYLSYIEVTETGFKHVHKRLSMHNGHPELVNG